jgi:predicted ATP-grasp superfamily ATP-dependent carboligase
MMPAATLPLAVVLGADTPIGLTVVRELGQRGVPVHAILRRADGIGGASRYCASASVRGPGALADWLPQRIEQTGAAALFAISEGDLIALAALPERIGACRILTPRAEPLARVLDKPQTLAAAAALGIDTPETWQPEAGQDFAARAAALDYPVVLKWADPQAVHAALDAAGLPFLKAEFAGDAATLLAALRRSDALGLWPLVQRYCPGSGLGQMFYMADGEAVLAFQHRRLHEWPPEGGVSSACASEPLNRHTAQRARSADLLRALDWSGPAMVEYRHDVASGRYWLMEVNGRFWGSLPLTWHCGVGFAWEAYRREILGERDVRQPRIPLRHARYMAPETRRLWRVLAQRRRIADPYFRATPLRDLLAYVGGFLDPRGRYYVWSLRDPLPFLADARAMAAKALGRGDKR